MISYKRSTVTIGLSRTVFEINGDVRRKSPIFPPPVYLTPPLKGFPWNFVSAQGSQKTRLMGLSDGRKSFPIGLAVLIKYRSVTATQPASHVAVAITLNAKASSLKTIDVKKRFYVFFIQGTFFYVLTFFILPTFFF